MTFSVGQLYSAQRLLTWIQSNVIRPEEVSSSDIVKVFVCPAADVLEITIRGAWATVDMTGALQLTARGQAFISLSDEVRCLREQLRDLVSIEKPTWAKLIGRGRRELLKTAPTEIAQILQEAGLLDSPPTDEVVRWWDDLSEIGRGMRAADSMETGRRGERLTMQFERRRTNSEPVWQCIESNRSGFDVLSVVATGNATPLRIEVKASARNINAADFSLTRPEWDTACTVGDYIFHLWQIFESAKPRLAAVSVDLLRPHVPQDQGDGEWQQVRVPFKSFRTLFIEV